MCLQKYFLFGNCVQSRSGRVCMCFHTFLSMRPDYLNAGTGQGQGLYASRANAPPPQEMFRSNGYSLPVVRRLKDKSKVKTDKPMRRR